MLIISLFIEILSLFGKMNFGTVHYRFFVSSSWISVQPCFYNLCYLEAILSPSDVVPLSTQSIARSFLNANPWLAHFTHNQLGNGAFSCPLGNFELLIFFYSCKKELKTKKIKNTIGASLSNRVVIHQYVHIGTTILHCWKRKFSGDSRLFRWQSTPSQRNLFS